MVVSCSRLQCYRNHCVKNLKYGYFPSTGTIQPNVHVLSQNDYMLKSHREVIICNKLNRLNRILSCIKNLKIRTRISTFCVFRSKIGMKIVMLFSLCTATILTRTESGTAFIERGNETAFYTDAKTITINILRPTPRSLLNSADYHLCNQRLDNFCDFLFNTFDREVLEFLNLKLVKRLRQSIFQTRSNECPANQPYPYASGNWCCSSNNEKSPPFDKSWAKKWNIKDNDKSCDGSKLSLDSKCCDGNAKRCPRPPCRKPLLEKSRRRREEIHPFAKIVLDHTPETPNSTSQATNYHRSRRGVPIVAQFAIVVAFAVSAYFIGEAVVEDEYDNVRNRIFEQEKAIKSLSQAVELDHTTLSSVVNQLRIDSSVVVAPNVTNLSSFYTYMKSKTVHNDFDPNKNVRKFQRYFTSHISELSKDESQKFETNVLNLQNNRLPLNKDFLIAVRAQCTALQTKITPMTQNFCNDIAFHATRWNTGLTFNGVGFELDENKKLKSTIYSLTMRIPILQESRLQEYDLINLGRFQSENLIRKIELPAKAIVNVAGQLHPFNDHHCIQMNKLKVCPEEAIGSFSECLQTIFSGTIAPSCKTVDTISPTTCIGNVQDSSMIISMFGNGTAHYDRRQGDLVKKPEEINSFAVVSRSTTRGTLFCKQSKHRHIAPDLEIPIIQETERTYDQVIAIANFNPDLKNLPPVEASINKMNTDLAKVTQLLAEAQESIKKSHNVTHNTIDHIKNHFSKGLATIEEKFDSFSLDLILKIILPIILPPLCIGALVLVFWNKIQAHCKKQPKKTSEETFSESFLNSQHNSRTEEIRSTSKQ